MTGHLDGHLDADGLAEYRAGLITGRRSRAIAAHMAGCTQCTSLGERLAEVSALLAAAPVPALTDVVAGRLDRALAAAQAQRVPAERTGVLRRRQRGRHAVAGGSGKSGGSGGFLLRWVLAPAAAAIVLAAGGFGLSQLHGSSGTIASSSSVSRSESAAGGTGTGSTGNERMQAGGQLPGAASLGPNHAGPAYEQGSRVFVVDSNVDYEPAVLGTQLAAQLGARSSMRTVLASPSVAACVQRIADGSKPVLAEVARYRGSPATVVVVTERSGYLGKVAGSRCSNTDSDIVAMAVLPAGISAP
jgi:hypothetical protein